VWNLLGLPSYRRVHCDTEAEVGGGGDGDGEEMGEMGIVAWMGANERDLENSYIVKPS
jgi:hypothetical protein